ASRSPSGTATLTPATDAEYAAAVASAEGRDVVVVGGDGSVHRLLQQLADLDLLGRFGAVGVVPTGTGNDLARGAGPPLDPDAAVDVALTGRAGAPRPAPGGGRVGGRQRRPLRCGRGGDRARGRRQGVAGPCGLPRRRAAGGPDLHRLAPAGGDRRGG